jgi:hypothetical protein
MSSPSASGPLVTGVGRAELAGVLQARGLEVDGDDPAGAHERSGHDRGQADGARADDGDGVARLHPAVEHADLVARGQDVGEEEHLLVRDALGQLVHRGLGERHPRVLGLHAVDEVAEDPADAARGLAVGRDPALAVGAAPARGDGGTSTRSPSCSPPTAEPVATTVPTASWPRIRPSVTAGTSPLRMCRSVPQIVVVSTLTTTSVGSWIPGSSFSSQSLSPTPW